MKLGALVQEIQEQIDREEALWLVSAALDIRKSDIFYRQDEILSDAQLVKCRDYTERRATGEPLAYIHGEVEFYDCTLHVTPAVLIPRPETEILADLIVHELQDRKPGVLWDICCGSGCLGIALKKKNPEWKVILADLSPDAVAVATENAMKNAVGVDLRIGDLLLPFTGEKADVVVCNPPYIPQGEYEALDAGVRDFEPELALLAGESGLEVYERLAEELPALLSRQAKIYLEIGYNQGKALMKIFSSSHWKRRELRKDYAGWDRFFLLDFE